MSRPRRIFASVLTSACFTSWLLVAGCDDPNNKRGSAPALVAENPEPTPPATTTTNQQQPTPPRQAPPIVAVPSAVHFGIVEPGSTLETSVTLHNPTDKPMRIIRAQPSCTCTTVDMNNVTIPAQGSVEMPITLKTNRSVGTKVARVQLIVASYGRFFTIDIDAENAWAVRTVPPHIPAKEKGDAPAQLTGTVTLDSVDERPFTVLNIMDGTPEFVGFDPSTDAPRNTYTVRYNFNGLACDDIPPFWIIRTDHPKAKLIDMRVRHDPCTQIIPGLPINDYRSSIGEVQAGDSVELLVTFKKPRKPRVESVTCADPRLRVTVLEQKTDGKELKVECLITIDETMPAGLFQIPIVFSDGDRSADHVIYGWVLK